MSACCSRLSSPQKLDRVLLSYGFNSYRLRVNKLELELELSPTNLVSLCPPAVVSSSREIVKAVSVISFSSGVEVTSVEHPPSLSPRGILSKLALMPSLLRET